MNISTTKKPILIRAGHSDLAGVYAKPSRASRALIVALHGGGNSAAIFDDTNPWRSWLPIRLPLLDTRFWRWIDRAMEPANRSLKS